MEDSDNLDLDGELTEEERALENSAFEFIKVNKQELIKKFADPLKYQPVNSPVSLFMAGSPGAGKTEISKSLIGKFIDIPIRIDADEIRQMCPLYTGSNAHIFQKAANKGVNILFDHAIHKKLNLILDGTFAYAYAEENIKRSINKGRFGREYEMCKDNYKRENWDLQLGLGHEKVFDVRERFNDVTMIAEFFTEDFCKKHNYYNWEKRPSSEPGVEAEYQLVDRDWKKTRNNLIQRHLNRGLPEIKLVDPNGKGRNILVLQHSWDGRTLHPKYGRETMRSLARIWRNPVALLTKTEDEKDTIFYSSPEFGTVKELKRSEWLQM
jgi:hypothetical protein